MTLPASRGRVSLVQRAPDWGLHLLLVATPFAFGGAEAWGQALIQVIAGGMLALWLIGRMAGAASALRVDRFRGILWASGLLAALGCAQTIPLPRGWIAAIAPATERLYTLSVPGYETGRGVPPSKVPGWLLRDAPVAPDLGPDDDEALVPPVPAALDAPSTIQRPLSCDPMATRRGLILFVCMMGLLFYVASQSGSSRIAGIVRTSAGVAVAVTLFGLIQMMTWNGRIYWVREGAYHEVFGPFVNRNAFAAFAIPFLPILTALAIAARRRDGWIAGGREWIGGAVIAAGILASLSRAGILAAAFSLAVLLGILYVHDRRPRELAAAILVPIAGGAIVVWKGAGILATRLGTIAEGIEVPSVAQRLDVWWRTLALVRDNLLFGAGIGTYRVAFLRYAPSDTRWWMTAHNDYLEILSEAGVCGALCVAAGTAWWARRVLRLGPFRRDPGRYLHAGLLAGLLGVFLHAATNADLPVPAVTLVVVVLAGCLLALASERVESGASRAGGSTAGSAGRATRSRTWGIGCVAALALINTWDGVTRFTASTGRIAAASASRKGELKEAHDRILGALSRRSEPEALMALARIDRRSIGFGVPLSSPPESGTAARLGEGIGAALRAIDLSPAFAPGWMEVALVYQARGDDRARRAAMMAAGRGGTESGLRRGLDGADRVALAAAGIAARLQPEDPAPHDFMARLLRDRGETRQAADHLRRSFSLLPSPADHEWVRTEDPDEILGAAILEGIEDARPAAGRPPAVIARSRAEMLGLLGRSEEAIEAWRRVVDGSNARGREEAWLMIGKLQQALGRPAESLDPLRRATSGTSPWAVDAHYFLGKAHAALGQVDRAVAEFRVYLERRPGRPLAHLALGQALINAGEYGEAEAILEKAEGLFPGEERIRPMLDQAKTAREAREER